MDFLVTALIIYIVVVILSGFVHDLPNAIMCGILAIIVLVININLSTSGQGVELFFQSNATDDELDTAILTHCVILYIFFVIRYIPCVKVGKEKHTYLIFGTLIEETETIWVGVGTMLGVPLLLTVGAFFLAAFLHGLGFIYINYVFIILAILHCVVGVTKAIISNYVD